MTISPSWHTDLEVPGKSAKLKEVPESFCVGAVFKPGPNKGPFLYVEDELWVGLGCGLRNGSEAAEPTDTGEKEVAFGVWTEPSLRCLTVLGVLVGEVIALGLFFRGDRSPEAAGRFAGTLLLM